MFLAIIMLLTTSILLHIAVTGKYGYVGDVEPALARRLVFLYILPGGIFLHFVSFLASWIVDGIARRPLEFPFKDFLQDWRDLPSVIADVWKGR